MQMQEYIYLGTTPMYFLGASGRIVGSESNPHTLRCPQRHPSFHLVSSSLSLSLSLSPSLSSRSRNRSNRLSRFLSPFRVSFLYAIVSLSLSLSLSLYLSIYLSVYLSICISLSLCIPVSHAACMHTRVPPPRPILRRFTSKLARSPGLIDRQVMGQFNLISKINNRRRRRWSIYSENPASGSRHTAA